MRVRAIDSNGDYVVANTANEFLVDSAAAVAQLILTALQLWQGQWFLDVTAGVPYSTKVLGKYTMPVYDTVLKNAILNVPGVNAITAYSSSVSKRALTVNVTVDSIYGPVSVTATL
jgi:hypothetical protein